MHIPLVTICIYDAFYLLNVYSSCSFSFFFFLYFSPVITDFSSACAELKYANNSAKIGKFLNQKTVCRIEWENKVYYKIGKWKEWWSLYIYAIFWLSVYKYGHFSDLEYVLFSYFSSWPSQFIFCSLFSILHCPLFFYLSMITIFRIQKCTKKNSSIRLKHIQMTMMMIFNSVRKYNNYAK